VRQEVEDEDEVPAEAEEEAEDEEGGGAQAEAEEEGEASLDEILAKKPDDRAEGEDDDDSLLALGRDDRSETLSVKVEPKKDTEFVCRKCHLVKPIRSQLVDKTRMLCRDCA